MKKLLFSTILLLSFFLYSKAQTTFQKTFGTSVLESGNIVKQTQDKGFIIVGYPLYSGPSNIIKTDSSGNKIWSKNINEFDIRDIIETTQGDFVLAGVGKDWQTPNYAANMIKLNSSGNIVWQLKYTFIDNNNIVNDSYFNCIKEDIDHTGYILTGNYFGSLIFMKVDNVGAISWVKKMLLNNNPNIDILPSVFIQSKADSSFFMLSGYNTGGPQNGIAISKFRKDGIGIWSKTLSTTGLNTFTTNGNGIQETFNGNIMIGFQSGNILDFFELDTSGTAVSNEIRYEYPNNYNWKWTLAQPTFNNSMFLTFTTPSTYGGKSDIALFRTDLSGNFVWAKKIGGKLDDEVNAINESDDGGVVMVGSTKSFSVGQCDVYLLKADSTGAFSCNTDTISFPSVQYPTTTSSTINCSFDPVQAIISPYSFSISDANDTSYDACVCIPPKANFITNYPNSSSSIIDYSTWATNWFWDYGNGQTDSSIVFFPQYSVDGIYTVCLKVTNACGVDSVCNPFNYEFMPMYVTNMNKNSGIKISPNPFNLQTCMSFDKEQKNIIVKIMDVLGKEIKTTNFTGTQLIIEKGEMKEGMYFVQITDENKKVINKKILIQ